MQSGEREGLPDETETGSKGAIGGEASGVVGDTAEQPGCTRAAVVGQREHEGTAHPGAVEAAERTEEKCGPEFHRSEEVAADDERAVEEIFLTVHGPLQAGFPEAGGEGASVHALTALGVEGELEFAVESGVGGAVEVEGADGVRGVGGPGLSGSGPPF